MLTRRTRDLLAQKTEPTPFAAKAKDLGALRDAVVDAASVGAGLWLSYLFALFYFAIAAGAVTHRDLLLESPVKLPFLTVELPLKAFFVLGPLVFLIVHAYVLLHFVLLAGKVGAFHLELQAQIPGDDARSRLRRQLPNNIFVQSLAGPREARTGVTGFLLRRMIEISLVAGPIALLVLFPLQFLPYHSEWITWWQRLAIVIDIALLWILWPSIASGETTRLRGNDFRRVPVLGSLLASSLALLLAVTIATFPGEWLEEKLPPVRLIPTTWEAWTLPSVQAIQAPGSGWATLHELLVAGEVNYVTGRPQSLWSNVLVLPNFEVGDRVKFDTEGKIAISSIIMSLRGRSLEGAVLVAAHLRKADFTGARLSGADFWRADLQEANFGCDRVGIEPKCTQLQGTNLTQTKLQGASFFGAQLQGANLHYAQLQGANLRFAQLQGAALSDRKVSAGIKELSHANLQGASLVGTQLQGASLVGTQLQASLLRAFVWRAQAPEPDDVLGANITLEFAPKYIGLGCGWYRDEPKICNWSEQSYAALKLLIAPVSKGLSPEILERIASLEKPPYVLCPR
jgi:hypothetical protein